MLVRLQKYLADHGIASRRKAEELILAGRIAVNGQTVTELGTKVEPGKDKVAFDGSPVQKRQKLVYIMLHKPDGYVTTAKDQFDRPTVMDLLEGVTERVVPVGRLDYETSGLLLLTNDGDLTYKLTHPRHHVDKVYIAKLVGQPNDEQLQRFRHGLVIDGQPTSPAKIEIIRDNGKYCTVKITIHEGRNRQVRKMCEAIGHRAALLKRVATGNLFLGDLPKGAYRHLTPAEVAYLKRL